MIASVGVPDSAPGSDKGGDLQQRMEKTAMKMQLTHFRDSLPVIVECRREEATSTYKIADIGFCIRFRRGGLIYLFLRKIRDTQVFSHCRVLDAYGER
jgi:hypothetical protein